MQHDFAGRNGSENVGDVLANIRRLIAQDQAEHPAAAQMLEAANPPAMRPGPLSWPGAPLVLARQDRIAGEAGADEPLAAPLEADSIETSPDISAFSPEEEAEFAEAEAALARMLAPVRPIEQVVAVAEDPEPLPEAEITRLPVMNLFARSEGDEAEVTLREMIRAALREELEGELGMRVSRQLHQLVRQEVEAVLREICAEG